MLEVVAVVFKDVSSVFGLILALAVGAASAALIRRGLGRIATPAVLRASIRSPGVRQILIRAS